MSTLEEMRAKTRAKGKDPKVTKKVWVQPEAEDFARGRVLSFDQTLGKTGWSVVQVTRAGISVLCGLIVTPKRDDLKGFEETFYRAEWMGEQLSHRVLISGGAIDEIVHEMPSVHGKRIESSLMAAREIRRSTTRPVVMINRQAAYATLTGNRHAPKSEMTRAVERLVPEEYRFGDRWNQDIHDSIGLALKHLYDKKVRDDTAQEG